MLGVLDNHLLQNLKFDKEDKFPVFATDAPNAIKPTVIPAVVIAHILLLLSCSLFK